ncbi:hypothetical protein N6H14_11210 [Paenibacillus sp. CC-CFT747]|nr:hypothetical protein N6H14_11210 [Paenibacillus sp. CC-CFT747]
MECIISLERLAPSQHGQVKYASAFVDETIEDISLEDGTLRIVHHSPKGNEGIEAQVNRLIDRFSKETLASRRASCSRIRGRSRTTEILSLSLSNAKSSRCLSRGCSFSGSRSRVLCGSWTMPSSRRLPTAST